MTSFECHYQLIILPLFIIDNHYMSKLYLAFLTLSDHAARKSGDARRKPGTSFSDAIRGALGRYAAQSSGVKNIASAIFFTLFILGKAYYGKNKQPETETPLSDADFQSGNR